MRKTGLSLILPLFSSSFHLFTLLAMSKNDESSVGEDVVVCAVDRDKHLDLQGDSGHSSFRAFVFQGQVLF